MKINILFILILLSHSICASDKECKKLNKELDQLHQSMNAFKLDGHNTYDSAINNIPKFTMLLILLEQIHQVSRSEANFNLTKVIEKLDSLDPVYKNYLHLFGDECRNPEKRIKNCEKKLSVFKDEKIYLQKKESLERHKKNHEEYAIKSRVHKDFVALTEKSNALAKKILSCEAKQDENIKEDKSCDTIADNKTVDELGSDVMEAVVAHEVAENKAPEIVAEGVPAPVIKDEEPVAHFSESDHSQSTVGSSTSSVELQKYYQQELERKQYRREAWGKVARISAVTVVAGGVLAGAAFLIAKAFDGQFVKNETIYNNTYTTTTASTPVFRNPYSYNDFFQNHYSPVGFNGNNGYGYGPSTVPGVASGYWNPYMNQLQSPSNFSPYSYGYSPYYP